MEAAIGLLAWLVTSGRIVDVALGCLAIEVTVLALMRHRLPTGALAPMLAHLAAGAFLLLALRAALTGAGWPSIAILLLGGLVAHGCDLALRLSRR